MRNPAFNALLDDMKELHDRKNEDYAGDGNPYSNFEFAAQTAGVTVEQVFRVLIGVKLARLNVLRASGKTPNHESIADTEKDLAVYAALLASYAKSSAVVVSSGFCGVEFERDGFPCMQLAGHEGAHVDSNGSRWYGGVK